MEPGILEHARQLLKLMRSKKLAAIISLAWSLLHLAAAQPAQFPQLRAYCNEHMHWFDLLGIIATARLIIEFACLAWQQLRAFGKRRESARKQRQLEALAIDKTQSILNGTDSEEKELLTALLMHADMVLNPCHPITKQWSRLRIITLISTPWMDKLGHAHGTYTLTPFIRRELECHRRQHP